METPKTPRKPFYNSPAQMPGGFWETLQPLADWLMRQLVAAYDSGYTDGRAGAAAARCEAAAHRELDAYIAHMSHPVPKV
jgi:hypothetical protein